ncbi:type IV secretion system DNA-binding domain-containing protein [Desulfovibrio desulfuricans]|uniref:type IV secretion system DNA-binding domain-containing protein n=1 Tax=Desulfovibrio desulfuricans TaxID=876 RepID=UPI0003B53CFB|nr:type IV secretion system DNA-binding domain-containing protein [Desulfovibrio desulfuricans]
MSLQANTPSTFPDSPYRQHRLGFLASVKPVVVSQPLSTSPSENALFTFDSGRTLSFADGARSIAIIGGTGSGKTTSVILPMIDALMRQGFGGVILDIKGNLGTQTRALALKCGRQDDVIEFGSSHTAQPTNLLAGLKKHEIADLFQVIALDGVERDPNASWHAKGGALASDVAFAMLSLSKIAHKSHFSQQFSPTLKAIYAALCNQKFSASLWSFFCQELGALRAQNMGKEWPDYLLEAESFYHAVSAECFHVLETENNLRSTKGSATNQQQKTWMLQRILMRLKTIKTTCGLMDCFSSLEDGAVPIDFTRLVYKEKKIVLIHFAAECGATGAILARCLKERFYQSILKHGRTLGKNEFTFMVGDEFQEIMDVGSANNLNDMQLFGLSREFKNINIVASQSIASLYARGERHSVSSLLGNCTTKILLQSSDPETLNWVKEVREDSAEIKTLERGECFWEGVRNNGPLVSSKEQVNVAHKSVTQAIHAQKPLGDTIARRQKTKLLFKRGMSGLPLSVERAMLEERSQRTGGLEMRCELVQMRQESLRGGKYWEQKKEIAKPKETAVPAEGVFQFL